MYRCKYYHHSSISISSKLCPWYTQKRYAHVYSNGHIPGSASFVVDDNAQSETSSVPSRKLKFHGQILVPPSLLPNWKSQTILNKLFQHNHQQNHPQMQQIRRFQMDDIYNNSNHKKRNIKNKNKSKHRKQRQPFLDKVQIHVSGGDGGKGCLSHVSKGSYKRRPDGGHGGNGGNVILVASKNVKNSLYPVLQQFGKRGHFVAGKGTNGGSNVRHGRNGKDMVVFVPCGVVVREIEISVADQDYNYDEFGDYNDYDLESHTEADVEINAEADVDEEDKDDLHNQDDYNQMEEEDDDENLVNTGIRAKDGMYHWSNETNDSSDDSSLNNHDHDHDEIEADLDTHNSYIIAATGGRGGTGNSIFASRKYHYSHAASAAERSIPKPPTSTILELELKLLADMGLVGYPNAGKSTLLHAMSRATPKIAPYPFTTLHPLVGCIEYRDGVQIMAADVPGLIEGAASGRGRGIDFLRHLERTKALLFIVDGSLKNYSNGNVNSNLIRLEGEGRAPVEDLKVLANELTIYDEERMFYPHAMDTDEYNSDDRIPGMMERPALVVVNKLDLIESEEERQEILLNVGLAVEETGIQINGDVIGISAGVTGEGLRELSQAIRDTVELAQRKY